MFGGVQKLKIKAYAGTALTLNGSYNNCILWCTSNSAVVITWPTTLGAGFNILIKQVGSGQVSISKDVSFSYSCMSSAPKTAGQGASMYAYQGDATTIGVDGQYL